MCINFENRMKATFKKELVVMHKDCNKISKLFDRFAQYMAIVKLFLLKSSVEQCASLCWKGKEI